MADKPIRRKKRARSSSSSEPPEETRAKGPGAVGVMGNQGTRRFRRRRAN